MLADFQLTEQDYERIAELVAEKMRGGQAAWMTLEEVAEYAGIPASTIYKNDMPRHKPAGRLLFFRAEVDAWMRGAA